MVKRGVSQAEKRERLKKILEDKRQPMTIKDMEKLGMKAGVNSMTIKGVLTELVDDNEIELDKIGSTNFVWYFPSKELRIKQLKLEIIQSKITGVKETIEKVEHEIQQLEKEREDTPERIQKLENLSNLKLSNAELLKKISVYKDQTVKTELIQALSKAKAYSNRWTDNTWALGDYLKKKFGVNKRTVNQQLRINESFDYAEFKVPKALKKKK